MKIGIFDLENGQIERDATTEEKKQIEKEIAEYKALEKLRETEAETKATAKAAILDRIGLTADELKTILG